MKLVLLSIANAGLTTSFVGVGPGGFGVEVGFGVAAGLSSGVGVLAISTVGSGDGETMMVGTGVGAGYRPLTSSPLPRVMNHAISTPEAPRTRTIANTHGKARLREPPCGLTGDGVR